LYNASASPRTAPMSTIAAFDVAGIVLLSPARPGQLDANAMSDPPRA
jgi:hypothetical protein